MFRLGVVVGVPSPASVLVVSSTELVELVEDASVAAVTAGEVVVGNAVVEVDPAAPPFSSESLISATHRTR